jgi:hypothetical protein
MIPVARVILFGFPFWIVPLRNIRATMGIEGDPLAALLRHPRSIIKLRILQTSKKM